MRVIIRCFLENIYLSLEHLAVTNRRDIMFRPNVAFEDVPADTELETLKYFFFSRYSSII